MGSALSCWRLLLTKPPREVHLEGQLKLLAGRDLRRFEQEVAIDAAVISTAIDPVAHLAQVGDPTRRVDDVQVSRELP
jgi:hypothetical protein